ncbi:proto-oncogene tyrosine-protein kinase ROS-like isoform X2 [Cataglyphis hispanica]|nr:proto-oncogene tyrosine-protein kinase ROS-like isoform X2 [Cataglyphis hispanica]
MHENPIPQLLMVTENGIDIWDLDSKINVSLVKVKNIQSATYSIAEHKIYWSNKEKELMLFERNENNITRIVKLLNIAYLLCIDWIARNLYWLQFDLNISSLSSMMRLDLTMWEKGIVKYEKISEIMPFKLGGFNVLPSLGILYWTSYVDNRNQLMQSDLDGNNTQIIENNLSIICPFSLGKNSRTIIMKIDDMNSKMPLIYWLSSYFFFVTDINGSRCNLILEYKNVGRKTYFLSFVLDKTNIYISTYFINGYVYILKKEYALLDSVDAFKHIRNMSNINVSISVKYYAFEKSLQSYPPTKCLTPDKRVYKIEEVNVTTNSIIINLPEPVPKSGCKKHNLPATLYTINISYCLDKESNLFDNLTEQTYERHYEIQNLTPLTEYKLLLILSNFYSDQLSMGSLLGSEVTLRTKASKLDAPDNVTVEALTPTVAAVYWIPPKKLNCIPVFYKIYWTLITNNTREISESLVVNKIEYKLNNKYLQQIIESLLPGQVYWVYVRIYLANYSDLYTNSLSKTLYMYPEPSNITLNKVSRNGMNISWIPSVNLTIYYVMQYRNVEAQKWQIANNFEPNNEGTVMYYIKNLLPETLYEFRLILRYPNYEKDYIWPSDGRFIFPTLTSGTSVMRYYLSFIVSLIAMLTIICIYYFYYLYRQRKRDSEQVLSSTMTNIELAILHEIPDGNLQFNTLYSPMLQYNSDEYEFIKIKREDIRLEKLLGSGTFGLVFQGKVKNLKRSGTEISVAIKTLRKNASSQEKKKFLKEARLMNHFCHKHVLQLLAICSDEDSPLIILELMEIDLLQYLKDSRKLQPSDSHALRLHDLFAMCEDVARGCCYLENLRFVHRDLACRNCLVSARDRDNRVIKIGDFGLARDVYKDDYYRVKERALLPVCWMAPESLVIGIFTSQSDVWSFGVLMWEITSLGERPYTGKTNEEVIDYVRAGGRLPMPVNCPPILYELMLRCWSPADHRPNFKVCLKNIVALKSDMDDTLLSTVDII